MVSMFPAWMLIVLVCAGFSTVSAHSQIDSGDRVNHNLNSAAGTNANRLPDAWEIKIQTAFILPDGKKYVPPTRAELGWDEEEEEEITGISGGRYYKSDGTPIKNPRSMFVPPPTLGESIARVFTGQNDEQAMEVIQSHVGGWFLGLVLGFIAYLIVRPKAKCSTSLEMARRWMSWGLMGGMTTGTTHFFRYGGAEGIAGGLLGVCFFSGAAWVLGLAWGWMRFRLFPKIVSVSDSLDGEADKEINKENLPGIREAAVRGQARDQYLLGLCYYEGKSVVKNQVEAYMWMLLAQANGFEKARKISAKMEKALSRTEVAEGQKLATQMQQG